jgi:peptidoglycan/LPS O-acetylase OafA/YrhL
MNAIFALAVGFIAICLFVHFWGVKDGVARILLLLFFGTIGIWSTTRAIVLTLVTSRYILSSTGMDIIGGVSYLIYLPVIISAGYIIYQNKKGN